MYHYEIYMLITSYINRTQHFELLYLVVFEILIPKVRNVFIESPDILSTWQDKWNGAVMNKLHFLKPVM